MGVIMMNDPIAPFGCLRFFLSMELAGFCGETEEDHQETLSLLREVSLSFLSLAFFFAFFV